MPNTTPPAVQLGARKNDREPINLTNGKPFRSKELKAKARANAEKVNGTYYSSTQKLYHGEYKG